MAGWLRYCVPAAHGGALTRSTRARSACCARRSPTTTASPTSRSRCRASAAARSRWPARRRSRRRYLPRVARGEAIAAFALSEPDAGSDVARDDDARATRDGDELACSTARRPGSRNGGIADFYACSRAPSDGAGRARHHARSSSMRTRRASRSPSASRSSRRIRSRALRFEGCRVAGRRAARRAEGEGFKLAMARSTSSAPRSRRPRSASRGARSTKRSRTRARRAMFGQTLADFQLTQAQLGRHGDADRRGARCSPTAPPGCATSKPGARTTREAAMAKMVATETAQQVIDARACSSSAAAACASGTIVERLYREIRALRIYEGATEVQQLIIARETCCEGARMSRCAPPIVDTFARDRLPPPRAAARVPVRPARAAAIRRSSTPRPSCSTARSRAAGANGRRCVLADGREIACTYAQLAHRSTASPTCWSRTSGLVPGNRVLLRGPNNADDGGVLARGDQGRADRGADDAAAARDGTRRRSSTRRRSARRCATSGCATNWRSTAIRRTNGTRRRWAACCTSTPTRPDSLGVARARQAGRVRRLRDARRRSRADRIHVGHDRPAERHGALPSRRARDVATRSRATCSSPQRTTSSVARRRWPSPSDSADC